MTPVLEVCGLGRSLPGDVAVTLVDDVTLAFAPATFTAIVGPSGCGKSSLLYLLGLLDRPSRGRLLWHGHDLTTLDGDALARIRLENFGFVFQFHFLLPEFTGLENVMLPILRRGTLTRAQARLRAADLLAELGLEAAMNKTPDRMSGGERQRVAIARALANDPELVLGDEPTGNLDSLNSRRVVETFQRLAHVEGRAVICVTHDLGIADAADVRISMLDGRVTEVSDQRVRTEASQAA